MQGFGQSHQRSGPFRAIWSICFRGHCTDKSRSNRIYFVKPWKLSRILQPFLPPEYSISDVNEINFFLKATNRFMQEIFSPDQNYVVVATKIIGYLDLSSLFTCRSVSKVGILCLNFPSILSNFLSQEKLTQK